MKKRTLFDILGWLILLALVVFSIPRCISRLSYYNLLSRLSNGKIIHRCDVPLKYQINENVPKEMVPFIHNAFEYWNSEYNGKLYAFAGTTKVSAVSNLSPIVIVSYMEEDFVKDKERKGVALARTTMRLIDTETGCMGSASIVIFKETLDGIDCVKNTTMRHEIGHTLGFDHSDASGDLMYWNVSGVMWMYYTKSLSDNEVKAFHLYY